MQNLLIQKIQIGSFRLPNRSIISKFCFRISFGNYVFDITEPMTKPQLKGV